MRHSKFWIASVALLLGTMARAQTPPTAPPTPAQVIAEITQALTDAGTDPTVAGLVAPVLQMALARAQVQTMLDNSTALRVTDLDTKESSDVASLNAAIAALSGGAVGPAGPAATVAVGSVTAAPAGTVPAVTNSGTSSAAVLNFVIPAGAPGANGAPGLPGSTLPGYAVPAGYAIQILAVAGRCAPMTTGASGSTLVPSNGTPFFCDYDIFIPQDGNYVVTQHMAVTSGSALVKYHYELPLGSVQSGQIFQPAGTSFQFSTSAPIALKSGLQTLRLSMDTPEPGTNTQRTDWLAVVKQ